MPYGSLCSGEEGDRFLRAEVTGNGEVPHVDAENRIQDLWIQPSLQPPADPSLSPSLALSVILSPSQSILREQNL